MINRLVLFSRRHFLFLVLLLVASLIFCSNLGGQGYSLDEPETVLLARTIPTHGVPVAWDGHNFVSGTNGADSRLLFGQYVWTWHPWLQHYVAFMGIFIGGENPAGARIVFAIFGVFTVLLLYNLADTLFSSKWIAFLVSLQLVFLLPFFLYMRQARYYSLSTFFSVAVFYLMTKYNRGTWKRTDSVLFLLTSILLFFSNYVIWAASIVFVLIILVLRKNKTLLLISAAEVLFAGAWYMFFRPDGGNVLKLIPSLPGMAVSLLHDLSYINNYLFALILLIPVGYAAYRKKHTQLLVLICLWTGTQLIFAVMFLDTHGRYLIQLAPVFLLLTGVLYTYLWDKKMGWMVPFLVLILSATTLFNQIPQFVLRHPEKEAAVVPAYVTELTGKYPSVFNEIGSYMKRHARPGDLFLSNENRYYLYETSGVPSYYPLCHLDKKRFKPISSVANPARIAWVIMFQNDTRLYQHVSDMPCVGSYWQKERQQFKRIQIPITSPVYAMNDPDIVNRTFPPVMMHETDVVVYERIRR